MGSVSRRGFVAGAAALATLRTRADWLKFFRRDREEPENFHVLRRPFGSDPSREISLLGCGGVRLCVEHSNQNKIDRELATEIFDYSYRHGVNFFDTGYVYHGGDSEKFLNEILVKYPRESFFFTDKMPTWHVKALDDAKRIFKEQCERTAAIGYFDVYMLHSLSNRKQYDQVYRKLGVLDYLKDMMAAGKIRRLGFSYHGTYEFLSELVEECNWALTLIPFNGVEPKGEANRKVLAAKKIPIFVMSPLGGGRLAHLNTPARRRLEAAKPGSTPAEYFRDESARRRTPRAPEHARAPALGGGEAGQHAGGMGHALRRVLRGDADRPERHVAGRAGRRERAHVLARAVREVHRGGPRGLPGGDRPLQEVPARRLHQLSVLRVPLRHPDPRGVHLVELVQGRGTRS